MRTYALRFGLSCAALWIVIKMIVFISGKSIDLFDFTVMANNFMLLTAVALSIFMFKRSQAFRDVPKLEDIKTGIFAGMVYTGCVVLFSYFYNAKLDSSVLEDKIEQRVRQVSMAIDNKENFTAYKKINPEASKYTREQIIERERESTKNFLNPRVSALLLVMFFTLLTIFYAIFITLVIRKIYLKGLN